MSNAQDMCPICAEPFQKDHVLVRYVTWGESTPVERLGHLDCVLFLSKTELHRTHPSR